MNTVILDTDIGVDDSLAVALAIASGIPVIGMASVFGNATVENTTHNLLTILHILKSNVKVFKGASIPLKGKAILPQSHGENGLGGFSLPNLLTKEELDDAVTFYRKSLEQAPEKSISIICLGPTTNIALLHQQFPQTASKIKELIILGGVFSEKGNMTPYAEFNVLNDPHALAEVLKIPCRKTIIPIEVCRKVVMNKQDFEKISNPELKETFKKIVDIFISYYTSDEQYAGFTGGVMYDLLAVAYFLKPELFTVKTGIVTVETQDLKKLGQTKFHPNDKTITQIATDCNSEEITDLFFSALNAYK